jgi:hypothetical protein
MKIRWLSVTEFSVFLMMQFVICLSISAPLAAMSAPNNSKKCAEEAYEAELEIRQKFGLEQTKIKINSTTVCNIKQSGPGVVNIKSAAHDAIFSFINDSNDIESPLALSVGIVFDEFGQNPVVPVPLSIKLIAIEFLRTHLNSSATTIYLEPLGHFAEHGEIAGRNWIFKMTAKSLSDHIFWAIVDRNGNIPVYNYGFN